MAEKNDDTNTSTEDEKTSDGSSSTSTERTFTQDEVDALVGKARNQGASAKARELSDMLGVSPTEAKKILDARAEAEQANMTEAERIRAEAEEAKAEAEAARSEAKSKGLRADLVVALGTGNEDAPPVRTDRVGLATDIALSKALDAPDGEDPIEFAVDYVRSSSPEWFSAASSGDSDGKNDDEKPPRTPPAPKRTKNETGGDSSGSSSAKSKFEAWKARNTRPDVLQNTTT